MSTLELNQAKNTASSLVKLADSGQIDAFSRLRISAPSYAFDAQLTYDLQPLLYEQITANGGTITYDGTNGCAVLGLVAPTSGAVAEMRSFEYFRYQPGRSQLICMTGLFGSSTVA